MASGSGSFDLRRVVSRFLDGIVLLLLVTAGFLALEFSVRPFYVPSPVLLAPQVRFEFSADFGWVMMLDPAAHTLDRPAPIGPDGFREMPAATDPEAAGGGRWLLLGGGNAFGVGVDASDTFLALAAHGRTPPAVPVNAGCEGYNLSQSVRIFEKKTARLSPDLLLVTFEPEDLQPGSARDSLHSAERFARLSPWINRTPNPENPWETLKQNSRFVHFMDARIRGFLRVGSPPAAAPDSGVRTIDLLVGRDTPAVTSAWNVVSMEFDELARAAERAGSRVCVIILPFPDQVRRAYPRAHYQSRIHEICARKGFLCVDPLEELMRARENRERVYLPRRPFLAPAGHRAVARAIGLALDAAEEGRGGTDPE